MMLTVRVEKVEQEEENQEVEEERETAHLRKKTTLKVESMLRRIQLDFKCNIILQYRFSVNLLK